MMSVSVLEKSRGGVRVGKSGSGVRDENSEPEEVMAYCPGCKALQTIWLTGETLMTTSRFTQQGNLVFHNCGSRVPCRLYYDRKSQEVF